MDDKGTWKVSVNETTLLGRELVEYADVTSRENIDGGPIIQKENLAFSDAPFQIARGNWFGTRGFKTLKEFANNKDSNDWYDTAAQTFGGVFDVTITHKDYTGTETAYEITQAHVSVSVQEPIGVSVQASIKISGGKAVLKP